MGHKLKYQIYLADNAYKFGGINLLNSLISELACMILTLGGQRWWGVASVFFKLGKCCILHECVGKE